MNKILAIGILSTVGALSVFSINKYSTENVFNSGSDSFSQEQNSNGDSLTVIPSYSNDNLDSMALGELSKYNQAGSCYVGYDQVVYDVSNHPMWSGCQHNGITGGQDITEIFPHPTTYLDSLPIVAKLTDGSQASPNNTTDFELEDESEIEDAENEHQESEDEYEELEYEDD